MSKMEKGARERHRIQKERKVTGWQRTAEDLEQLEHRVRRNDRGTVCKSGMSKALMMAVLFN